MTDLCSLEVGDSDDDWDQASAVATLHSGGVVVAADDWVASPPGGELTSGYSPYWVDPIDSWAIEHVVGEYTYRESAPTVLVLEGHRAALLFKDRGTSRVSDVPSEVRREFEQNRSAWSEKSALMSSLTDMAMLDEYQRIIGLGPNVVPLIIEALRDELDHWFWALRAIVGEDHAAGATSMSDAAENWISWYDSTVDGD